MMETTNPNQEDESYLLGLIQDFDREREIFESEEPLLVVDSYYAGLKLSELRFQLMFEIRWYERKGISSEAGKEAKKRLEVPPYKYTSNN